MLNFEQPEYKIIDYIKGNNYGKFELEPLERGFGTTIGNSLRRVMLSSMPGSAIVAVKIEGAMHEFQTLDGIYEDVTAIILNLKNVVVKNLSKENQTLKLSVSEERVVTAADFEINSNVEIMNKDQVIATVSKGGNLDMEILVSNGRGYVPSNDNKKLIEDSNVGFIPMDALYSPVEKVSYEVESARVGQDANYDKLIMEVCTNGSIKPEEAMALAAKIMIEHLNVVTNLSNIVDSTGVMNAKVEDTKNKRLETTIDELEFSQRASNCLKRANIHTLGDLTDKTEYEMQKIRNLGKKLKIWDLDSEKTINR